MWSGRVPIQNIYSYWKGQTCTLKIRDQLRTKHKNKHDQVSKKKNEIE